MTSPSSSTTEPQPAPPSIEPGLVRVEPSPIHGLGLFVCEPLAADTVVGRLEGVLTDEDGMHVLWLSDELAIELTNDLRYVNHSDDPNAALTELGLVTLHPVEPGEELTHDYGW
ncbi:MAG: SET domain-containing protein [Actinomycetota bacterium]